MKIKLTILLLLLSSLAFAFGVQCQIDGSNMYFTGQTKTDRATGKLLKHYKCSQGHEFWLADEF